jgi:hypothetical protein
LQRLLRCGPLLLQRLWYNTVAALVALRPLVVAAIVVQYFCLARPCCTPRARAATAATACCDHAWCLPARPPRCNNLLAPYCLVATRCIALDALQHVAFPRIPCTMPCAMPPCKCPPYLSSPRTSPLSPLTSQLSPSQNTFLLTEHIRPLTSHLSTLTFTARRLSQRLHRVCRATRRWWPTSIRSTRSNPTPFRSGPRSSMPALFAIETALSKAECEAVGEESMQAQGGVVLQRRNVFCGWCMTSESRRQTCCGKRTSEAWPPLRSPPPPSRPKGFSV